MDKNNLGICAFTDFWVDCYSTAIYSILLSKIQVDKAIIYNNNYWYDIDEIEPGVKSIYPNMNMVLYNEKMLVNYLYHDFVHDSNTIETVKHFVDQGRLVFIGVDMFDWIKETESYQKNHLEHYSMVNGYDEKVQCMRILETGDRGYEEFMVPYENVIRATKGYSQKSLVCQVDTKWTPEMYSLNMLKENAIKIVSSIDACMCIISDLWQGSTMYSRDMINSHLFSCENRNKVNKLLFMIAFLDEYANEYVQEFGEIERAYNVLKSLAIKKCYSGKFDHSRIELAEVFGSILKKEQGVWQKFVMDNRLVLKF